MIRVAAHRRHLSRRGRRREHGRLSLAPYGDHLRERERRRGACARGDDARRGLATTRARAGRGRSSRRAAGHPSERRFPGACPREPKGSANRDQARRGRSSPGSRQPRPRRACDAVLRTRLRRDAVEPAVLSRADARQAGARARADLRQGRRHRVSPDGAGAGPEGGRAHVRRRSVSLHRPRAFDSRSAERPRDVLPRRLPRRAQPAPRTA